MSEFDVTESDVVQGKDFVVYISFVFKEYQGVFNREIEHVSYVFSVVLDFKHLLLETFAMTTFTAQEDVGHELHFDFDLTFALAGFATAAFNIK